MKISINENVNKNCVIKRGWKTPKMGSTKKLLKYFPIHSILFFGKSIGCYCYSADYGYDSEYY